MVGIAECCYSNGPGCVPVKASFIYQEAHQLSHPDRRMRVIELNGVAFCKIFHWHTCKVEEMQHVLKRAGNEEKLLCQPQTFTGLRLVVRIQHFCDGFGS